MLMRLSRHLSGVIGWPLEYTLSPVILTAAFRHYGLDWAYFDWPVAPRDLSAAIDGIRVLQVMGANVTMPHKTAVLEFLDAASGDARTVGAVNTIHRSGDRLVGHNTDIDGFADFITDDTGIPMAGKETLVLGAGGAARAVVVALDRLGLANIAIAARSPERAEEVASLATHARAKAIPWTRAEAAAEESELTVNATPIGARGEDSLPGVRFRPGQTVVDLIYNPPATPLVGRARAAGADAWGGLGMLVHQAGGSFRIWTGQDPPLDVMSAAALRALRTSSS
jgi:shikimate dehydrogenase